MTKPLDHFLQLKITKKKTVTPLENMQTQLNMKAVNFKIF